MKSDEDLREIEALHQRDMKASKEGDYKTLRSLFTGDAVVLPPNGHLIQGADQLDENFQNMEKIMRVLKLSITSWNSKKLKLWVIMLLNGVLLGVPGAQIMIKLNNHLIK